MNICFFDLPESSDALDENDVVRAASSLANELCKWEEHRVEFYDSKAFQLAHEQPAEEHFKQFLKDHQIDVAVWHTDSLHAPFSLENLPCKLITVLHIVPTDSEQFYPDEIIKKLNLRSEATQVLARCKPRRLSIEEFRELCSSDHFSSALQASSKFVLLSDVFFEQALHDLPDVRGLSEKICVIPDIGPFGPFRASPIEEDSKISWRRSVVLLQKGPGFILQIWQRIQDLFPDWKLRFDGDVEYISKFKPLAKQLGLKNVSFEDGKGEPVPYDGSATIFCSAYSPDGLSLLINKTLNLCRVHELQGISNEAINDRTFSLPDSPSEADLHAKELSLLMNNISLWALLVSGTQKYSSPCFATEEIADKWEKLLRELVR